MLSSVLSPHSNRFPDTDLRGRSALVTGGLGFIGSRLVAALLERKWRIRILDDGSTGRASNLGRWQSHPRLEVIRSTVLDASAVESAAHGSEFVFNLAAVVGVRRVLEEPERTWSVNGSGAKNVIDAARRSGAKLVLFSSSEVYGPHQAGYLGEDRALDEESLQRERLRGLYARAKRVAELTALRAFREDGLEGFIVRPFNITGPGHLEDSGMVLPRFVSRALDGRALEIFGDGRQRRSFLHVDDAVSSLIDLLNCKEAYGQTINLGASNECDISTLAQRVCQRLRSTSPIVYLSYEKALGHDFADCKRRRPDLHRLHSLIDRRPSRSIENMIDDLASSLAKVSMKNAPSLSIPCAGSSAK